MTYQVFTISAEGERNNQTLGKVCIIDFNGLQVRVVGFQAPSPSMNVSSCVPANH